MFGSSTPGNGIDSDLMFGLAMGAGARARAADDLALASQRATAAAMESLTASIQGMRTLQNQVAELRAQLAAERALTQALSAQHPDSPILPLAGLIREAAGNA
ncbi:hypothetical protein NON00_13010 [Roseomonas sp. GC11]|uniref:hypothetical protein n=1 Tax=Roseomonas sp. GC11 TaxID=2950546 RepID=UPI00210A8010|nr:hypothetical protein [Roseomonas sp. GC11]MCQ4160847.1 hypothetical protein [Roseomonas sp. GC11]